MTKKQLTDLLREEVQKPPEAEPERSEGETPSSSDQVSNGTKGSSKNTPTRAKRTSPTKAELENTVAELKAALAAAQVDTDWQRQLSGLQAELQEQRQLVNRLKADLEKANQLQSELEQAKAVIRSLTEVNDQLTQDMNALKKHDQKSSPMKLQVRSLPYHSVQHKGHQPLSTDLSDSEIGWVD